MEAQVQQSPGSLEKVMIPWKIQQGNGLYFHINSLIPFEFVLSFPCDSLGCTSTVMHSLLTLIAYNYPHISLLGLSCTIDVLETVFCLSWFLCC